MTNPNQIALRTLRDNVATLAIEMVLVQNLVKLFTVEEIAVFSDEKLRTLTSEPSHVVEDRTTTRQRLHDLKSILETLDRCSSDIGKIPCAGHLRFFWMLD